MLPTSYACGAALLRTYARIEAGLPLAAAFAAILLAGSACSPEAAASRETKAREARSESARSAAAPSAAATPKPPAETPRTSGQMQREAVAQEGPSSVPAAALVTNRRCGWLSNPTPGNWWLFDGHGEWILATQGGDQVPGFDDLPDMSTAGWVETNGHYGYGCACMTLSYDPATHRVTRIAGAKPKPLKQCRADRGLPRP
jgi:hypothetical protein